MPALHSIYTNQWFGQNGPKPLLELAANECKWPIGDPRDHDNFCFCAGLRLGGSPYCASHHKVAYT